jgi:hypothetical protein
MLTIDQFNTRPNRPHDHAVSLPRHSSFGLTSLRSASITRDISFIFSHPFLNLTTSNLPRYFYSGSPTIVVAFTFYDAIPSIPSSLFLGELSGLPREDRFLSLSIDFSQSQEGNHSGLPSRSLSLYSPLPPSEFSSPCQNFS